MALRTEDAVMLAVVDGGGRLHVLPAMTIDRRVVLAPWPDGVEPIMAQVVTSGEQEESRDPQRLVPHRIDILRESTHSDGVALAHTDHDLDDVTRRQPTPLSYDAAANLTVPNDMRLFQTVTGALGVQLSDDHLAVPTEPLAREAQQYRQSPPGLAPTIRHFTLPIEHLLSIICAFVPWCLLPGRDEFPLIQPHE